MPGIEQLLKIQKNNEAAHQKKQRSVAAFLVTLATALSMGAATFAPDQGGNKAQAQDGFTPTRTPSAEVESRIDVTAAPEAFPYPSIVYPDPSRQMDFPGHAVRYEEPFEDSDYFEHEVGDIDLPQFYFRVMTAGEISIPGLDIDCKASKEKGCLVILINHFGPTAMFRDARVDNGFTVGGRVYDMGNEDNAEVPDHIFNGMTGLEKTVAALQALLDHYIGRMTISEDGANCGTIKGCKTVEWHVVVVGDGEAQSHWRGVYSPNELAFIRQNADAYADMITTPSSTPTISPTATAAPGN